MEPRRHNISHWKWGHDYQTLERDHWQFVDPERALRVSFSKNSLVTFFKTIVFVHADSLECFQVRQ